MNGFSIFTLIFALVAAAIYFSIVYFAGKRGLWWLAILVSLPAIMALIKFMQMPDDFVSQSPSVLIRHIEKVGIFQLVAGLATYFLGQSHARKKGSQ